MFPVPQTDKICQVFDLLFFLAPIVYIDLVFIVSLIVYGVLCLALFLLFSTLCPSSFAIILTGKRELVALL